jgi:hypothetical protein
VLHVDSNAAAAASGHQNEGLAADKRDGGQGCVAGSKRERLRLQKEGCAGSVQLSQSQELSEKQPERGHGDDSSEQQHQKGKDEHDLRVHRQRRGEHEDSVGRAKLKITQSGLGATLHMLRASAW